MGRLQKTEEWVQPDSFTSIRVEGLVVPQRPHNTPVTYTLTVTRDSSFNKRSAKAEEAPVGYDSRGT